MVEPSQVAAGEAVALLSRQFDRGSLGQLRGELTDCGAGNGLADLALSNFVLAVNEIATNAVRHGGGAGCLELWRARDELICQISDTGRGIPASRLNGFHRPQPGHIGGWGLWLARHLCHSVEIDTGKEGTRVLLRYPIPSSG
jgi:serine/threonine-protein kinase RsbW